jgi:hypothetical protein
MTALQAWPFVVAAYAVTITGTLGLVAASLIAMRRAEARAKALDERR